MLCRCHRNPTDQDPTLAVLQMPLESYIGCAAGAIGTLLISDELFRINDVAKRRRYVALVDAVKAVGGETLVFSSMHISGEQLKNLSGLAAILRFPLPDLEDMEIPDEFP